MEKVVWGSGTYARRFANSIWNEISFFIDSDIKKTNQLIKGKRIYHPSEISDWSQLYFYIPYNYYEEITSTLSEYGVKKENYEEYNFQVPVKSDVAWENLGECLKCLEQMEYNHYEYILNVNEQLSNPSQKIKCSYFSEMQKYEKIVFGFWDTYEDDKLKLMAAESDIITMPIIVAKDTYIEEIVNQKVVNGNVAYAYLNNRCGWKEVSEQIQVLYQTDVECSLVQVYCYYYFWERVLGHIKPKGVIMLATVSPEMRILELLCKEQNIPYVSTHIGLLPGTINFDVYGEVGKSIPAVCNEKFRKLKIDTKDLELAQTVCNNQRQNRLNRRLQPKNDCISYIRKRLLPERPILFFSAQTDGQSNMVPYTNETRDFFSPIFKSSIDAGIYLAELCRKNNWNFIYKPHPLYIREGDAELLPDNAIWIEMGDITEIIDISDVVITILSSTNYDAMMRDKPVVMLGYNWSRGQGCTYEVFEKKLIERTIQQAIVCGFTESMKKAFVENVARLLKYYLYDDLSERSFRYGKPEPQRFDDFFELVRVLEAEDLVGWKHL